MTTRTIAELTDYLRTGHARRYRSSIKGADVPPDPAVDAAMDSLVRDGYLILESLLTADEVDVVRREVTPHLPARTGRNAFEGQQTQRIYGVMAKTFVCNALVEHPRVLALLDRILEPNYLLSQLQVINILPGEAAQPLHYDDGFYPMPRPRPPYGAATILALDDFTADNGATVVIPGSHLWGDRDPTLEERAQARPVVMPKGSAVFFLGTLWHGGGANRSRADRLAVTAQYCAPWARQQENFSLSVPKERARQCSARVQSLLGYSIHPPFMGMVNGMHPLRVLED